MPEILPQAPRRSSGFNADPLGVALQDALAPTYVLVRSLGTGGMGSVYLARDPLLKRFVAVKVLAPALAQEEVARARFRRESLAVAAISHPNVVGIYSVGKLANDTPYYVMQYVEGASLSQRLATTGRLPTPVALRALRDVAAGLAAAHRQGIVHRDVKPENMLVDAETGRVLVSDFGVAAVLQGEEAITDDDFRLTKGGMTLGTPAYMSPEQFLAEPVTDRSDVYSLGVLGYELLSGHGPFPGCSPRELAAAHLRDEPVPLDAELGEGMAGIAALLKTCLAKEPLQRPSAEEVARRLSTDTTELVEWPPPGMERLHGLGRRLTQRLVAASLLTAVSFGLLTGVSREGPWQVLLPPAALLFAFALFGVVLLVNVLLEARPVVTGAMHAMHAGYSWRTVAEALADTEGDGGALIAGTGRYAALSSERRTMLRHSRVLRALLRLAAAFLPVIGLFIGLRLRGSGGVGYLTLMLLPSFVLFAIVWALALLERATVGGGDQVPGSRRTEDLAPLADGWYSAIAESDRGQGPRPANRRSAWLARIAFLVTGVFLTVSAGLIFLLAVVTAVSEIEFSTRPPSFTNAQAEAAQALGMRDFRLPPDSSITPEQAGLLLHAVMRPKQDDLPTLRNDGPHYLIGSGVFPTRMFPSIGDKGWAYGVMRRAGRGFSAHERALLDSMAAQPAGDGIVALGRAPRADVVGGRYNMPLPTGVRLYSLPMGNATMLNTAAGSVVARAALARATGHRARADSLLRDIVNTGLLLLDSSPFYIDDLFAAHIIRLGRDGLTGLAESDGDIARVAALEASVSRVSFASPTTIVNGTSELRQYLASRVKNDTIPAAFRWLALESLAVGQCSDAHDLIFGSPSQRESMQYARTHLARSRGEQALLDTFDEALSRPERDVPTSLTYRAALGVARVADRVVGGRRIESCTSFALLGAM